MHGKARERKRVKSNRRASRAFAPSAARPSVGILRCARRRQALCCYLGVSTKLCCGRRRWRSISARIRREGCGPWDLDSMMNAEGAHQPRNRRNSRCLIDREAERKAVHTAAMLTPRTSTDCRTSNNVL